MTMMMTIANHRGLIEPCAFNPALSHSFTIQLHSPAIGTIQSISDIQLMGNNSRDNSK